MNCKGCNAELSSFIIKKKCKLCSIFYLDYKFCSNCTKVKDSIFFGLFGERYCKRCMEILNESENTKRNSYEEVKDLSLEIAVQYINSGKVPYDAIIEQVRIMSIIEAKQEEKKKSKCESNYPVNAPYNDTGMKEDTGDQFSYIPENYDYRYVDAKEFAENEEANIYNYNNKAHSLPSEPKIMEENKLDRSNQIAESVYISPKIFLTDPYLDYKLLKKLGTGSAGSIFLAENL